MARDRDIQRTIGNTEFGGSLDDESDTDLERGYSDAMPASTYEGSLDPTVTYDYGDFDEPPVRVEGGTRHAGFLEPDDAPRRHHGDMGQFGFVRRPERKSDVERN